jgi:Flp pilus assembly protein TadG
VGARRRKAERGAAAVEFALLLLPLMMILLGTIDWGYFFFVEQLVTNASREGARTGSLTPYSATDPGADAKAEEEAEAAANAYLTAAGLDAGRVTALAVAGPSVQVTVSYTTGSITGFTMIKGLLPARASATATMRR